MVCRFQFTLGRVFLIMTLIAVIVGAAETMRRKRARDAALEVQDLKHLKALWLAIQNYHYAHGTLPPPYTRDAAGRPMHSWRVLLMPYLDDEKFFEKYHLDEPRDSPSNRLLGRETPMIYRSPAYSDQGPGTTSYLAVVGPETAWPANEQLKLGDIPDGSHNTILIFEVKNCNVNWTEPRDMTLQEAIDRFKGVARGRRADRATCSALGKYALFADGRICRLDEVPSSDVLKALITRNGGEDVNEVE